MNNSKMKNHSTMSTKEFLVTGVTKALKEDGLSRKITLVATVSTETIEDNNVRHHRRIEGQRTVVTTITDKIKIKRRTVSFGLAVVSPHDEEYTRKYKEAEATGNKLLMTSMKGNFSLVTPEQGKMIALGKAQNRKSALAVITCDTGFINDDMVSVMLNQKLKQITEEPDRFIRTGNPRKRQREQTQSVKAKLTPASVVAENLQTA